MSEYQFVHFIAIDAPISAANMEFMQRQSSRASISNWEFSNEYHYGDFRGDADEMLRRGYDMHLHYANFGIRMIKIRLPCLPCDPGVFERFELGEELFFSKDKSGAGGILTISPDADADTYEYFMDADGVLPQLRSVREQLLNGDVRALYLAWLALNNDPELVEPPVPAGLYNLDDGLETLADFYELSPDLRAAAADQSLDLPSKANATSTAAAWVSQLSADEARQLLVQVLGDDFAAYRRDVLKRIRSQAPESRWPMNDTQRTFSEIQTYANQIELKRIELFGE